MVEDFELPLELPLASCKTHGTSFELPVPISARLDKLVGRVRTEGRIHRRELISALILCSTEEPVKLASYIRKFRSARVRDAGLHETSDAKVVHLSKHRPGPRKAPTG